MTGQVRSQLSRYPDRTHAGTTAAMGYAKGFVEVQVTNIRADQSRRCQANLGVHVGPVHINLAAIFVNNVTNFLNLVLKNTVGAGISDH